MCPAVVCGTQNRSEEAAGTDGAESRNARRQRGSALRSAVNSQHAVAPGHDVDNTRPAHIPDTAGAESTPTPPDICRAVGRSPDASNHR